MKRPVLTLLLLLGCGVPALSVAGPVRELVPRAEVEATPLPAATAVQLDGEFNDEVWLRAPATTAFVQREPKEGAQPSFPTEVKVAYDATALYVAVRAFDPDPAHIVGHLTRRDVDSPSDWVRVLVDSYYDRRTAYEFAVNPAGVKQDRYWYNDRDTDDSWDAVWDVEVTKDGQGWKAEFKVPFSQLRFNPASGHTFGFAVVRQVGRLNETSTWPLLSKSANGYVSSFGDLTGLSFTGNAKRIELVPYTVAQVKTQPQEAGNPFIKGTDPNASFGADLKWALTPGLTFTATINPDFGQVEADPAVVNLSAFETFFEERRPFFVEGSGTYRFDVDCNDGRCTGLFYSRRIGREPQGDWSEPDDGYSSAPGQTTILGAGKLTGRVGSWSIGALNAVTSKEIAHFATSTDRYQKAVEPATNYAVFRARREYRGQSSLGFMMTSTNRGLNDDLRQELVGRAYTGGVDWDWRFRSARYSVKGYWATSMLRGDPEAIDDRQRSNVHSFQRPDADHITYDPTRTSLNGHSGNLSLSKIAGEHVRFSSNLGYKSPGFDINDLGFLRRADMISFSNWIQWRQDKPNRLFRNVSLNLNQWNGWNFNRDLLYRGGNINGHVTTVQNWRVGGGFNVEGRGFDDRLTRGGPGGYTNPVLVNWHYVESDNRKPVSANYFGAYVTDRRGTHAYEANPSLTFRPTSALNLETGISYRRSTDDYQWVEEVTDQQDLSHYVFGHLEQTTLGITARVNYTITPTLSVQLYAQPFVSAGGYTSFKELVNGRAPAYKDRFAAYAYDGSPDFNYRSLRTTNVLRWEYRPGSALFVVWQQGREDDLERGDFQFGRDFSGVFRTPATNVLLVKFAYWLNM